MDIESVSMAKNYSGMILFDLEYKNMYTDTKTFHTRKLQMGVGAIQFVLISPQNIILFISVYFIDKLIVVSFRIRFAEVCQCLPFLQSGSQICDMYCY